MGGAGLRGISLIECLAVSRMHADSAGRADGPPLIFHVDLFQGAKVNGAEHADCHMFKPQLL